MQNSGPVPYGGIISKPDYPRPGDGFRELEWRGKVSSGDEMLHALWGWIPVPDYLIGEERRAIVVRRKFKEEATTT
jgi:hypothetical protein